MTIEIGRGGRPWGAIPAAAVALFLTPALAAAETGVAQTGQGHTGDAVEVLEIPLHVHEGRLWIPVRAADGTEFRFLLSTGTPGTVFSETGSARHATAGALFMGGLAEAPVNLEDPQVLPDDRLTFDGERFDGQIAPNTLNEYEMLLDGPGGRLLLQPLGAPPRWEGYALSDPARLQIYHGTVLTVQVELGGTSVPAMFELGAPVVIGNPAVGESGGIVDDTAVDLRIAGAHWAGLPGRVEDHPFLKRFSPGGEPFAMVGGLIAVDCAIAISWVRAELRTCVR